MSDSKGANAQRQMAVKGQVQLRMGVRQNRQVMCVVWMPCVPRSTG